MNKVAFELRPFGDVTVLQVNGDIDIMSVRTFETMFRAAALRNRAVVIISLVNATYFDSRTIYALLSSARDLKTANQELALVLPAAKRLQRILEVAGIISAVPSFGSLRQALDFAEQKAAGGS